MVTDLAEVARLGAEKAPENLAFRRWLAAHHVPDREFQIIASEIEPHIDCRSCANCCRYSVVTLDEEDLARIAAAIGETQEEARRRYTVPDPENPHRLILASDAQGCVFLEDNLCLIYEARPRVCRDFPHIAPDAHSLGARAESHARWATLCPIIFNALEEEKRRKGFSGSTHSGLA